MSRDAETGSGDDAGVEQLLGGGKRRGLVIVALALALGLGALALLSQAADFHQDLDAFRTANKVWFAGLLAGQVLAYAGYGLGYRTIARACGGPCFPYLTTIQLTAVSFGAYVIGAGAGGLAVDLWAVHRAGEDLHRAGRRILAFNTLEWAILTTIAAGAGVAVLASARQDAPLSMSLAWPLALAGATVAALWISSPRRRSRFTDLPTGEEPDDPGRIDRKRLQWAWVKIRKGFADAIGGLVLLRQLFSHPIRYAGAPAGFALYWVGDMVTLYAAVSALGASVDPRSLALAYATGYVVTSAPLPAGAAGFSEAATAVALHLVGVPLGVAILAVLLFRLFTFWLPIPLALAVVPRVRALSDRLPDLPREADPPCGIELAAGRDS